MKKINVNAAILLTALLTGGSPGARAQSVPAPVPEKVSHEGAKYGHADSTVVEILKSTYPTEHFVFHFAEDKAALKDVFSVLEKAYGRVTKAFRLRPAGRLNVEIYPDIRTYHKRTFGENSQEWMVGNFDPDETVLRITSPNHPGTYHKYKDIMRVAVHEFVHSVTLSYRGGSRAGLPVWLDEGVAIYYQGPMDDGAAKRVKEAVAAGKVPTLAELDDNFMKYGGYAFSGTIVEFIVKNYGETKLMEFIKEPAAGERIFSVSEKEFGDAWRKYLNGNYK
ncbi:MAG: peptidase MA family metallohydrolase [Elusimicrobiales bacterium]|nr:peptidase MA family metallohydrolase [Elusimicrobiales bacterium]